MLLDMASFMNLAPACAASVAPGTLLAIARVESGLNPLAIGVNHAAPLSRPPTSRGEAIATAKRLLAAGANLDLGLLQINTANLEPLGLNVENAFDPCRNLAAGAALLSANYGAVRAKGPAPQAALRVALSLYNSGDAARGFRNGYVARVVSAAARVTPSLSRDVAVPTGRPQTAAWDAFGDLAGARFVATFSPSKQGTTP
jgi:type IV secretion system protein VirB1